MADFLGDCEQFELSLQLAMDQRLSPKELLGNHPHAERCPNCSRMLDDFDLLYQVLPATGLRSPGVVKLTEIGSAETVPDRKLHVLRTPAAFEVQSATDELQSRRARHRGPGTHQRDTGWEQKFRLVKQSITVACVLMFGLFLASRMDSGAARGGYGATGLGDSAMAARLSAWPMPGRERMAVSLPKSGTSRSTDISVLGAIELPSLNLFQVAGDPQPVPGQTPVSLTSCSWLVDQIPGVPPVRNSVEKTFHWIRKAVPSPQLPTWPELMPDLGRMGPEISICSV